MAPTVIRKARVAARRPGVWKPRINRFGAGRDGVAILDHAVGEPATYVQVPRC